MKISVIIPVYDVEKYIRKCLESAINQTYKNLEIIVVNDGTKDNSMKIVEEYLRLEKNKIEIYVLKKIFHKILKSGSIKGIKLINFSFWYNGIYNLRILKRIIKNFN